MLDMRRNGVADTKRGVRATLLGVGNQTRKELISMSLKKLSIALGIMFALSAVTASSAFATASTPEKSFWYVNNAVTPKEEWVKLKAGESREVSCKSTGALQLEGTLAEGSQQLLIDAEGVECISSTINQVGEMAEDRGKLKFTGVKITKPEGCKVPTTLETNALKTRIEEEGATVYDRFEPEVAGGNFITIPITECPFAINAPVKGVVYGQAANATGVGAVAQTLTFSKAINEKAGGKLTVAGETSWITGVADNELKGALAGHDFKAEAK